MSVLACGRSGCEKIMCDRLILNGSYYICERCYKELLAFKATWEGSMTKEDVRRRIEEFMETEPSTNLSSNEVDEEFRRLTNE